MAKTPLEDDRYIAGAKVMNALRRLGWRIEGAFWAYLPGIREWRLVFVTPQIEMEGDRVVLRRLKQVITELGPDLAISPLDVDIESPYDPVMTALGRLHSVVGSSGTRITAADAYGAYFDDLIVYHLDINSPFEPHSGGAAARLEAQKDAKRSRRRVKTNT